MQEILKHFPAESFRPATSVATNNPWWIMGHLNDIAVIGPLFHRGRLVGFAECMAHMADIGGSLSGAPREVFEEGLIIPPLRIVREGVEDATFFAMLEANVRVPRQVCGDVRALIDRLPGHGAQARRVSRPARIIRISRSSATPSSPIPKRPCAAPSRRRFPTASMTAAPPSTGSAIRSPSSVRVTAKGGDLDIDFTGSAAQSPLGINCTMVYTRGVEHLHHQVHRLAAAAEQQRHIRADHGAGAGGQRSSIRISRRR